MEDRERERERERERKTGREREGSGEGRVVKGKNRGKEERLKREELGHRGGW